MTGATKRLLIVAAEYPPSATVGAKRPSKLAARLGEFGWEPFVVAMDEGCYSLTDPALMTDRLRSVPTLRVPCRSPWLHSENWQSSRLPRPLAMGHRLLAKWTQSLLPTDKYFPWNVLGAAEAAAFARANGVHAIWATFRPLTALDLAYRVHRRTGIPLFLDFRDVDLISDDVPLSRHRRRAFARINRILSAASGITYAAPHMIRDLQAGCPAAVGKPSRLIWNWYERARTEASIPHVFDGITILYGGTAYDAYRFDGLFQAVAELRNHPEIVARGGLHVRFVGIAKQGVLRPLAERCGVADRVHFEGMVSEGTFRSYCRGSDVLLIMMGLLRPGWYDYKNLIPAKTCEYLGSGRPILVVGPPDNESERIVRRLKRGLAASDEAPREIAAAILALLDPSGMGDRLDLRPGVVSEFEGTAVIGQFSEFLERHLPQS